MRDRALLLLGFAGAFRRAELVGLQVEDLTKHEEGYVVRLRHSKTDQEGAGRLVGIPYGAFLATCPVRAVDTWLRAARIKECFVFRSVQHRGLELPAIAVRYVEENALANEGVVLGKFRESDKVKTTYFFMAVRIYYRK